MQIPQEPVPSVLPADALGSASTCPQGRPLVKPCQQICCCRRGPLPPSYYQKQTSHPSFLPRGCFFSREEGATYPNTENGESLPEQFGLLAPVLDPGLCTSFFLCAVNTLPQPPTPSMWGEGGGEGDPKWTPEVFSMAVVGVIIMEEGHRFFPQCKLPRRVDAVVPIWRWSKPIQTKRFRKRKGKWQSLRKYGQGIRRKTRRSCSNWSAWTAGEHAALGKSTWWIPRSHLSFESLGWGRHVDYWTLLSRHHFSLTFLPRLLTVYSQATALNSTSWFLVNGDTQGF